MAYIQLHDNLCLPHAANALGTKPGDGWTWLRHKAVIPISMRFNSCARFKGVEFFDLVVLYAIGGVQGYLWLGWLWVVLPGRCEINTKNIHPYASIDWKSSAVAWEGPFFAFGFLGSMECGLRLPYLEGYTAGPVLIWLYKTSLGINSQETACFTQTSCICSDITLRCSAEYCWITVYLSLSLFLFNKNTIIF